MSNSNAKIASPSLDSSVLQDVKSSLVRIQTQIEAMDRRVDTKFESMDRRFDEVLAAQVEGLGKRLGKAENRITDLEKLVVNLELSRAKLSGTLYGACGVASVVSSGITFIVNRFF